MSRGSGGMEGKRCRTVHTRLCVRGESSACTYHARRHHPGSYHGDPRLLAECEHNRRAETRFRMGDCVGMALRIATLAQFDEGQRLVRRQAVSSGFTFWIDTSSRKNLL